MKEVNKQGRKQAAHLFKKGVSGNPNGRPKGAKSKATLLKEGMEADWLKFLKGDDPESVSAQARRSRWDALMQKIYEQAMEGDSKALTLLMNEAQKGIREMNALAAKENQGPRSVKINIQTKTPEKDVQGLVLENEASEPLNDKGDDIE